MMVNAAQQPGWIGTETVSTRLGSFEFRGGFPTEDAAKRLADQRAYYRAVEVYLAHMPVVSMYNVWMGAARAGRGAPNQVVLWETALDARFALFTGSTEAVYALCALDLERDGPIVVDVPSGVMGGITHLWQGQVVSIGPRGADTSSGNRFLLLPPSYSGVAPAGYVVARSPSYRAVMGLQGFPVGGSREQAVAALRQVRVYALADARQPAPATFVNASEQPLELVFPETEQFFDDLAQVIEREPAERVSAAERHQLASIGIEKDRVFAPNAARRALFRDAARFGAAAARANSFASTDPSRLVYPDRQWEWAFNGPRMPHGSIGENLDSRAACAYIASGISPALVEHVVGQSSHYLWTPRDGHGAYLDGGKSYQLVLPPGIPVRLSWSVVAFDAVSRSMLENGGAATVSQFSECDVNADGSVELYFGPQLPRGRVRNWVRTVPGRGWFPLLRFCGPLPSFFHHSWKPDDIIELRYARPSLTPLGRLQ